MVGSDGAQSRWCAALRPPRSGRAASNLAWLFALAGFLMQEALTEGLLPWKTVGCPGCPEGAAAYDIGVMRWYGAEHGATLAFLFSGSLIALLWRARAKPLLLQFYALGHLLLVL